MKSCCVYRCTLVAAKDWDVRKYCCFSLKSLALYFCLDRETTRPVRKDESDTNIFFPGLEEPVLWEKLWGLRRRSVRPGWPSVKDQLRSFCGGTIKRRMLMEDVLSCSLCVIPRRVKKPSASVTEAPTFPLMSWTWKARVLCNYPEVFGCDDIVFTSKNKGLSFLFQDEWFWDKSYAFSVILALMKSRTGTVLKHPSVWKSFQKRR